MYKFIDVNEVSESAVLPSEALQINGEYIENLVPGYRTLSVSGREALSKEIESFETGARDGATTQYKRYPARTIVVRYQLIAESNEAFRAAYNALAHVLDVEDAELIFNDETDKYFTGTPSTIGEVEPGRNAVIGEFEIFCADPFKYSVQEYEVGSTLAEDGTPVFEIDYNGTYKSFPTLETEFYAEDEVKEDGTAATLTGAGECGFVAFYNENKKIIQLGDPEEIDGIEYPKSQMLIDLKFNTSNKWGPTVKSLWLENAGINYTASVVQTGSIGLQKSYVTAPNDELYLTAASYGTGARVYHGPSVTRRIPADANGDVGAANFTLKYAIKMAIGSGTAAQKQQGAFQCYCVNGSGNNRKIVAGMGVWKGRVGKVAELRFYVNGRMVDKMDIDLSLNNKYFGNNIVENKKKGIKGFQTVKTCYIEKIGNKVSFNLGGIKKVFTVSDASFADLKTEEITYIFSQCGNTNEPLFHNGLYYVKFTKHNCETWRNIPNKFNSADIVTANCNTGEILLNNSPMPQYGALGNDWEEFYLQPGFNQIGIAFSDWLEGDYVPVFKARYREVFL